MKTFTVLLMLILSSCKSWNWTPSICPNGGDMRCYGGSCSCSTSGDSTKQSADQNNR